MDETAEAAEKNTTKKLSVWAYRASISPLVLFQIASKILLSALVGLLKHAAVILLYFNPNTIFNDGELPYLARSVPGIVILVLGALALALYIAFDIHTSILISKDIVRGNKVKLSSICLESLRSLPKFFNPIGFAIEAELLLLALLTGQVLGISLPETLSFSQKLLDAVSNEPIWIACYCGAMILLALVIIVYMFSFHQILFCGKSMSAALRDARRMFFRDKALAARRLLPWVFLCIAAYALTVTAFYSLKLVVLSIEAFDVFTRRVILLVFSSVDYLSAWIFVLLAVAFLMVKVSLIFDASEGVKDAPRFSRLKHRRALQIVGVAAAVFIVAFSFAGAANFDSWFPDVKPANVIAHRGCGNLAPENTSEGVAKAVEVKVYGSEFDVQRTKDNQYVLNHDSTFERLSDDSHKSYELNFDEAIALPLKNESKYGGADTHVSSFESALDAAQGSNLHLCIELKGETADTRAADDVVAMVEDKGMTNQCSILCMNYDTIAYVEDTYGEEIDTVYLMYNGFDALEDLDCDAVSLETTLVDATTIDRVHKAGKRLDVWTCDSQASLNYFLISGVDDVITNEVERAESTQKRYLEKQSEDGSLEDDLTRVESVYGLYLV